MWGGGGQYNAWAAFLEGWGTGERLDAGALPPISPEDLAPDTWVRFVRRLGDALSARLDGWAAGLDRGITEARDEFGVGRALSGARQGLREIRAVANHPGLPGDLRDKLVHEVDRNVSSAQEELEKQAERMRAQGARAAAVEARLRTLRENRLTVVTAEAPAAGTVGGSGWDAAPPSGLRPRRRIVAD